MSDQHHVPIPGSSRAALPDAQLGDPIAADERVGFTVVLRRREELPGELVEGPDTVSQGELARRFGADPDDVSRVRSVFEASGVDVTDVHVGSRRITGEGPASAVAALFATELTAAHSVDPETGRRVEHRARSGDLGVPAALDGIVVAVLGLDGRPQASTRLRVHDSATPAATAGFDPPTLATVYGFPAGTDGTGQAAAIIELGGGYSQSDVDTYFQSLGIATPGVTAVGVDGASNAPTNPQSGPDREVLLDIEVLGALAPKAALLVYFAPNTDQGFVDAVSQAVHATPTPSAVSISWGQSEDQWTGQGRTALNQALADAAALGVTVTVASGDNGSSDNQNDGAAHVDFPASSPYVLACGGTSLQADASGKATSETVWNSGSGGGSTGGGVSDVFPPPSWQGQAGVPTRSGGTGTGRGVPDVAGDADPATGYRVRVGGQDLVLGGTSAVAPLWAALVCRLTQALNRKLGLLQPALYAGTRAGVPPPAGFRDITSGDNGSYHAGPGWDACTGLGVPVGTDLLNLLRANTSGTPTSGSAS